MRPKRLDVGSRTRKATFLHYRLARPPTSVCRTSGLRSWTAGPSIVCLKTNQRPLWASGILLYLPTHPASEHRSLLLRGPVFLFDVTPQHIHRPRSPSGGCPSRDDGSAEPCLQVGGRCMLPASDEASHSYADKDKRIIAAVARHVTSIVEGKATSNVVALR